MDIAAELRECTVLWDKCRTEELVRTLKRLHDYIINDIPLEYYSCEDAEATSFEDTMEEARKILNEDYAHVVGVQHRWDGAVDIDLDMPMANFDRLIMDMDGPVITVYMDRVEVENHHQDGTNRYTLTPRKEIDESE